MLNTKSCYSLIANITEIEKTLVKSKIMKSPANATHTENEENDIHTELRVELSEGA